MAKRILVIEDDKSIARMVRDHLSFEGFIVAWSETGDDAIQISKQFAPDLVLLDPMLSKNLDGLELCRRFAQGPDRVPVIIVSAVAEKEDRIRGLTLGADDYLVKPFALDELLARINAVLRRTTSHVDELKLGDTRIDFPRFRAFIGTRELVLTDREFEILRCLADRVGTIVSRDEVLRVVWGYSDAPLTRAVDNFIFRLRHKIEPDPHHPRYIRTAYGGGYRLTLAD
jgi:DNA-binding response OmpR family regulator